MMDSLGTLVLLSCHWGIDVDPDYINYVPYCILGSSRYCFGHTVLIYVDRKKSGGLIKAVTLNMVLTLLLVLCFRY